MVIATVIFLTIMILFGMYLNRYHSYLDRDYDDMMQGRINSLSLKEMNKEIVHHFNLKTGLNLVDESDEIIAGDYRRLQQVKSNV